VAGEESAEFVDGAFDAFFCGGFGEAEGFADFVERFLLEVAEDDGGAVGGVEGREGGVEVGGDGGVIGIGLGSFDLDHGGGLLFVLLAAGSAFAGVFADVVGDSEEPSGKDGGGGERGGFLEEDEEGGLGNVVGERGVGELAAGGGVDEGEVLRDDLGEGGVARFGVWGDELSEGVGVGHGFVHLCVSLDHGR